MNTRLFNNLFAIFLAIGLFQSSDVFAALSALNQSLFNMETVLSSPLIQKELSPYERVVMLQEIKQEEGHIYFDLKTEVITETDERGHFLTKHYNIDTSVKVNPMPGRLLIEVTRVIPIVIQKS